MSHTSAASYSFLFKDIASDGRCVNPSRDPPGQKSVYIPPGDPERETYRLSTFKNFPSNVSINPCRFAASGFYYTGFRDRVKCFSCGQAVDSWLIGDNVKLPEWHTPNCDFINGRDTRNIPIGSLYQNRRRHSTGNGANASQPATANVPAPQRNGVGNTVSPSSNLQRTSPPHSGFPFSAQSASVNTNGNASSSTNRNNTSHLTEQEKRNLEAMFPCLNPVNGHMRRREARLQTFRDNLSTWPSNRVRATPEEIAEAGMYYLGERDRVKCWYCNGGLQNWDRDDDPWEEHAKWFPMCEFLLQQKGPEFVHDVVARYPNLRRPVLHNPCTSSAVGQQWRVVQSGPRLLSQSASTNRTHGATQIIDPRKKMREWRRKSDEEMRSSELVSEARVMGFEDAAIREVLRRKFEATNESFSTFESLVEALVALPDEEIPDGEAEEEISSSANNNYDLPTNELSASAGLQEMRRLEESRSCKMCRAEPSCVVFVPCGHLATCTECSKKVTKCSVCKTVIQEKVRSYLS